jgi:hypothetical protein
MRSFPFLFVFTIACGGGSVLDPGSGNDPGSGTSTLTVDGSVTAHPRISNARNAADFETSLSVRVMLGTQAVTGGTVTVRSASGDVALIYRPDENRWVGTAPGYDEVYILDVESGADRVSDVRVDGPDIHFFTKPTAGATVDSTIPLDIQWDSGDEAPSAWIDPEELDKIAIPDTGKYLLAGSALKAERDKARVNTLRLGRSDRVTPSGAIGGSELTVTVENNIDIVVQANPAL